LAKQISGDASYSRARLAINFLGSWRLAVSLLVLLAIASVIGTVLNQQQPYEDYVLKFGSFWFAVFRDVGLYNVYRTNWYLAIVGFLVLSTSTCLIRNTPRMLREMLEPDLVVGSAYDPRWMVNNVKITSPLAIQSASNMVVAVMRGRGYRPKLHESNC
jgi:cytochrome c biogenesis protein